MANFTEVDSLVIDTKERTPTFQYAATASLGVALVIVGAIGLSASPLSTSSAAYSPAQVQSVISQRLATTSVPQSLAAPARHTGVMQRAQMPGSQPSEVTQVTTDVVPPSLYDALKLPVALAASALLVLKALQGALSRRAEAAHPLKQLGTHVACATLIAASVGNAIADPAQAFSFGLTEKDLYTDAWRAVQDSFIDRSFNGLDWEKVKEDALANPLATREETYTAIRDSLDLLGDPFTRLLDPPQYNNIKRRLTGRLTGVGMEIVPVEKGKGMKVVDRTLDSPAYTAGIKDGDILLAINGVPIANENQWQVAEKLVGDKGSQVTLTMQSPGAEPRDVLLSRADVVFQQVKSGICEGVPNQQWNGNPIEHLGYVRVPSFNYSTAAEFNKALKDLAAKGSDGVVVDLRSNTGGSLNAAYEMANSILPSGEIVRVIGSDGAVTSAQVRGRPIWPDIPVTLFVDDHTASSSEVLGAALKAAGRAAIAGEQTFGKGIIQDVRPLPDGSALFVTKERYLTPKDEEIDKIGITPTVAVKKELLNLKTGIHAEPTQFCSDMVREAPPLFSGPAPTSVPSHPDLDLNALSAFA